MKGQLNVEAVIGEAFALEPVLRGEMLCLSFSGNGDMDAAPFIGPFLKLLHAEVLAHGILEVVVDLRHLYFMNSSCFKALVWWVDEIHTLGDNGYSIRILADPTSHWQRRSLEALRRVAPQHLTIETHAEDDQ